MQETKRVYKVESYSGKELCEMFTAAITWLEKNTPAINALNVFPIPDGDCGTNMLLTMQSTLEEAFRSTDQAASSVAQAMSQGALMGARGNSGVILSQIFRGLAYGLEGKKYFDGRDFANALVKGSNIADKALTNPVEGTILTVARESSAAAQSASTQKNDLLYIMEETVRAARDSVANTPNLLPVLREAGVVDAGGQGLYVLFQGILQYLKGEASEMQYHQPQVVTGNVPLTSNLQQGTAEKEEPFGYCTEFVLEGHKKLNIEGIREKLEDKGQCLIAVGDERLVHIHIHTFDPGKVIGYATSLGTLHNIKIQNMDDQHRDFAGMSRNQTPSTQIATVAVVSGEGLTEVFRGLGVTTLITGGQTMNPSTRDLLQAIDSVPQDRVIILPNNKNIIPTAGQAIPLSSKEIRVVPTETIPQGIAALLAFNYDADLESNVSFMSEASSGVRTVEVTRAVRSTMMGDRQIKCHQAIGFIDGELVSAGDNPGEVLYETLRSLDMEEKEIITIYHGNNSTQSEVVRAVDKIRQQYPFLEIETIHGGQPHYDFIVSVE